MRLPLRKSTTPVLSQTFHFAVVDVTKFEREGTLNDMPYKLMIN